MGLDINIKNTPYRKLHITSISKYERFNFGGKDYEFHTIKKGTLLFRRTRNIPKIIESLVGYYKDKQYVYPQAHRVYFTMTPTFKNEGGYGEIQTIWELKDDIKLLVNKEPKFPKELTEACKNIDIIEAGTCLKRGVIKKHKIRGVFIKKYDPDILTFSGMENTSEPYISQNVSFFIRKKIPTEDIITPAEKFGLKWLVDNMKHFVVEPIISMHDNEILGKMYSDNGYKNVDGITYRFGTREDGSIIFKRS